MNKGDRNEVPPQGMADSIQGLYRVFIGIGPFHSGRGNLVLFYPVV